jgi:CDGSH-type Zn-finger protein
MEEDKSTSPAKAEVRILKDGPIMIKGVIRFRDSSGNVTTGEQELYICRCGGSANKPWCDETHKKIGIAY